MILDVENGQLSKKVIALKYEVPQNTLSTWIKNMAEMKQKFLAFNVELDRKKLDMQFKH